MRTYSALQSSPFPLKKLSSIHVFVDFYSRHSLAYHLSGPLLHLQDLRIPCIVSFIALTTLFHGCQLKGLFPSVSHGLLKGRNTFILESPVVNTQLFFYIYTGSHFTIPPNHRYPINDLLPQCMNILWILYKPALHLSLEIFPFFNHNFMQVQYYSKIHPFLYAIL